jgi:phosphoribosyl 1,2-cyclic phosphodiesterase
MFIKCWGTRGSIPVSGRRYVKYGGDTTCLEIRSKNSDVVVIDAGSGIRKLGNEFLRSCEKHCNFLFTHIHWDHILGFPFFRPLYVDDFKIAIYQGPYKGDFIRKALADVMKAPFFPLTYSDIKADITYVENTSEQFAIGSIDITPIALSHPNGAFGYKLIENDKTFIFMTDNELNYLHKDGLSFDDYVEFCSGADLLIHDAEYTPAEYEQYRGWGHSVYTDVVELALQAGVAKLGLHHINAERDDMAMDSILKDCRRIIQKKKSFLECFVAGCETEIYL